MDMATTATTERPVRMTIERCSANGKIHISWIGHYITFSSGWQVELETRLKLTSSDVQNLRWGLPVFQEALASMILKFHQEISNGQTPS